MAVALFVWLNTAWLRTAHHYFDVTWHAEALFKSFAVQTGYAILWSTLALVLSSPLCRMKCCCASEGGMQGMQG